MKRQLRARRHRKTEQARKLAQRTVPTRRRRGFELLEARELLFGFGLADQPMPPVFGAADHASVLTSGAELPPSTSRLVDSVGASYLPATKSIYEPGRYLTAPSAADPLQIALGYLTNHSASLGLSADEITSAIVTDQYTSPQAGTTQIYFGQMVHGLRVANVSTNINIDQQGRVVSAYSDFVSSTAAANSGSSAGAVPMRTAAETVLTAAELLGLRPSAVNLLGSASQATASAVALYSAPGLSLDAVPLQPMYAPTAAGLELVWDLVVRTPDNAHWYDLALSATTGAVVFAHDWVDDAFSSQPNVQSSSAQNAFDSVAAGSLPVYPSPASYNVFATTTKAPNDGARSIVVDPQLTLPSPYGWHDTNGSSGPEFTDTRGNNVWAQEDADQNNTGGFRPDGGASLNFDFPLDFGQAPANYRSAAITNLFYWNNWIHDVTYSFGFNEAAGNFQINDYSRGGAGNDPVQADAQDGSGMNNANFATPPDGQSPRMQMYVFNTTSPNRDGDLDATLMVHEYGHGISNRLTGGPSNANALGAIQSGGMGEGWSDWLALMLTQMPSDTQLAAYPLGTYVFGQSASGGGIRRYPYSFDMEINPLTFGAFNSSAEVHDTGEIWRSALWDLNWLLIDKYGYSANLAGGYSGAGSAGNLLAMQLVLDGMKLQPANPTFVQARDAIVQADQVLTGGVNRVEIWSAFARRGLGFSADSGGNPNATIITQAFNMPNFSLAVQATTPAMGAIVTAPPVDFSVVFSHPIVDLSVVPSDFKVNGLSASSVVLADSTHANFHFNVTPVAAQGLQSMAIQSGSILRASDGLGIDGFIETFRYDAVPLQVAGLHPSSGSTVSVPLTSIDIDFNEPYSQSSVSTSDLIVGQGSVIGISYLDADTVRFNLSGVNTDGPLSIFIPAGAITDVFGNAGFGSPHASYSASLVLDVTTTPLPLLLHAISPAGSLIYETAVAGMLASPADIDSYTIDLDAGQTIAALLKPGASLKSYVEIRNPANAVLGFNTATAVGTDAMVQVVTAATAGTYTVSVSAANATSGSYALAVTLNAALEFEEHGGGTNNVLASAQSIENAFANLGGASARAAVLGKGDASDNSLPDVYSFLLAPGESASMVLAGAGAMLELVDSNNNTLALGAPAINVEQAINNFRSAAGGTFYLRITRTLADYSLVVTKNAGFETEPNNSFASAQPLGPGFGALGALYPAGQSVDHLLDDGQQDNSIGINDGGDIMWMNSFDAVPGGSTITKIRVAWANSPFDGTAATVSIYDDPNDDGNPSDAVLLTEVPTSTLANPGGDGFVDINVPATLVGGVFFIAARIPNQPTNEFFAPIDTSSSSRRSWAVGSSTPGGMDIHDLANNTVAPVLIDDAGLPGNWLLRAVSVASDSDDWYSVNAQSGDHLVINVSAPGSGPNQFVNDLNAGLELYAPNGTLVGSGFGPGQPLLAYDAPQSGTYRVHLLIEEGTSGEYLLHVTGATGSANLFTASIQSPANGVLVSVAPTQVVVEFSDSILLTSLAASDLTIDGNPAISISVVDANTASFGLPSGLADGPHTLNLSGASVSNLPGIGLAATSSTFTLDRVAPRVVASSIHQNDIVPEGSLSYVATFNEPLSASSIDPTDVVAIGSHFGAIAAISVIYNPLSWSITAQFPGLLDDNYQLKLLSGIGGFADVAGNSLDGDRNTATTVPTGNGLAGGDFSVDFAADFSTRVISTPLTAKFPRGSLVYDSMDVATIASAADADTFSIVLDAGQTVTLLVDPSATLRPSVLLRNPANTIIGTASSALAGGQAVLQTIAVATAGNYTIEIGSLGSTSGVYSLGLTLNAALESEQHGGTSNNAIVSAQSLNPAWILLGGISARAAVLGNGDLSGQPDFYSFTLASGEYASLALVGSSEHLELVDANNQVLSLAAPSLNLDQSIQNFHAASAATYYAKVTGSSEYSLVLTKNAVFDVEANDSQSSAQLLEGGEAALGAIQSPGAPIDYRTDDGSQERSIGLLAGGDIMWLNSFDALPAGRIVTSVRVVWDPTVPNGTAATVSIYDDPDGDGDPSDAILVTQVSALTDSNPGGDGFADIAIPATAVSGKFFVAARIPGQLAGQKPMVLDQSTDAGRSWIVGSTTPGGLDIHNLTNNTIGAISPASAGYAGNFLLRAVALPNDTNDWYSLNVQAGNHLVINATAPGSGSGQFVNSLNAGLELYDAAGSLVAASQGLGNPSLTYNAALSGTYHVRIFVEGSSSGEYILHAATAIAQSSVVGRHLFYAGSFFVDPMNDPSFNNDTGIAIDKVALLPGGGKSTFGNISSYDAGINGIFIDLTADAVAHASIDSSDFTFRTSGIGAFGASNNPGTWTSLGAAPTVNVRPGVGPGGADRVELLWPAGTIAATWLQVIVKASLHTRLIGDDEFYFGSMPGETGNDTDPDFHFTDVLDESLAREQSNIANSDLFYNYGLVLAIQNVLDFNRDAQVDSLDQSVVREFAPFPRGELDMIEIPLGRPLAPITVAVAAEVAEIAAILGWVDISTVFSSNPVSAIPITNHLAGEFSRNSRIASMDCPIELQNAPETRTTVRESDKVLGAHRLYDEFLASVWDIFDLD